MPGNKTTFFHFIFGVIVIGDLIGQFDAFSSLNNIFKPLIMVWIGIYFYLQSRKISNNLKPQIFFAFFFSWLGDIFLMFQEFNPLFFITGLACFLISQITYILIFKKAQDNSNPQKTIFQTKSYLVLPFLIYGAFFYFLLFPNLDLMLKIAVLIYAVALVGMSATAFNRKDRVSNPSFWSVFFGAILFVISDSLIGVNKFLLSEPLPLEGILIMGTYIPAQYLIMRGLLVYLKENTRKTAPNLIPE
ncbi:lysoplasmalogenase [Flexithrix dorotheae]|uniref:lysoplasmalogenase n=1 Tax=Flexithrix dorotheae TaxID=70993 RepID=UPI0003823AA6|nr:lysoplasmalogenase [Flexithrix dorotheae]